MSLQKKRSWKGPDIWIFHVLNTQLREDNTLAPWRGVKAGAAGLWRRVALWTPQATTGPETQIWRRFFVIEGTISDQEDLPSFPRGCFVQKCLGSRCCTARQPFCGSRAQRCSGHRNSPGWGQPWLGLRGEDTVTAPSTGAGKPFWQSKAACVMVF